ncbi:MAG: ABA4-like family protein [Fulvivirga sp.]|nr:ABA4-like family protein [Fulvivirga sp.]
MSASLVFQIVNTIVLPAWLILIFFPGKSWRDPVIYSLALAMSLVYAFYVITGLGNFDPASFSTLEGVKALFTANEAVLAGWVHYLIFDLLIGNWIVNQANKYGINHLLIVPCLLFCFMFGPIGYLLYVFIKITKTKTLFGWPMASKI